jgi:hypothetical protein
LPPDPRRALKDAFLDATGLVFRFAANFFFAMRDSPRKAPRTQLKSQRARPLFPYPQVATREGSGGTDETANLVSIAPAKQA